MNIPSQNLHQTNHSCLFEEVTKSICADTAAVSVIITFVCILTRTLRQNEKDSAMRTMKAEMKSSLLTRFSDVEDNEKLTVAKLLDPRFKDKLYSDISVKIKGQSTV